MGRVYYRVERKRRGKGWAESGAFALEDEDRAKAWAEELQRDIGRPCRVKLVGRLEKEPKQIILSDDLYALEEEDDVSRRQAAPATEPPREKPAVSPLVPMLASAVSGALVGFGLAWMVFG